MRCPHCGKEFSFEDVREIEGRGLPFYITEQARPIVLKKHPKAIPLSEAMIELAKAHDATFADFTWARLLAEASIERQRSERKSRETLKDIFS